MCCVLHTTFPHQFQFQFETKKLDKIAIGRYTNCDVQERGPNRKGGRRKPCDWCRGPASRAGHEDVAARFALRPSVAKDARMWVDTSLQVPQAWFALKPLPFIPLIDWACTTQQVFHSVQFLLEPIQSKKNYKSIIMQRLNINLKQIKLYLDIISIFDYSLKHKTTKKCKMQSQNF